MLIILNYDLVGLAPNSDNDINVLFTHFTDDLNTQLKHHKSNILLALEAVFLLAPGPLLLLSITLLYTSFSSFLLYNFYTLISLKLYTTFPFALYTQTAYNSQITALVLPSLTFKITSRLVPICPFDLHLSKGDWTIYNYSYLYHYIISVNQSLSIISHAILLAPDPYRTILR